MVATLLMPAFIYSRITPLSRASCGQIPPVPWKASGQNCSSMSAPHQLSWRAPFTSLNHSLRTFETRQPALLPMGYWLPCTFGLPMVHCGVSWVGSGWDLRPQVRETHASVWKWSKSKLDRTPTPPHPTPASHTLLGISTGKPSGWQGPIKGVREGNGTPLQYACLENLMDRGAW